MHRLGPVVDCNDFCTDRGGLIKTLQKCSAQRLRIWSGSSGTIVPPGLRSGDERVEEDGPYISLRAS